VAEICINLEHKENPDSYQKGDVVDVQEDGFYWGNGALGQFKVIKIPGVPAEKFYDLLQVVEIEDKDGNPTVGRKRGMTFDLDAYEVKVEEKLSKTPKKDTTEEVIVEAKKLTNKEADDFKLTKEPLK
jgi:hypothetical protein